MLAKLFALLPFLQSLADLGNKLADIFKTKREREAGRNEAIIEQNEATNAEIEKAVKARRDQQSVNADPGSLREPDKYSRT